tara:strand:+ start:375 stop:1184 length:810 start_codon:yes stop_codon:yes gene_type:complete
MAITWKSLQEGDSIAASDLNSRFSSIEAEVNDLQSGDIQPRSLGQPHLPSMISQRTGTTVAGTGTGHTYDTLTVNYPNTALSNPVGPAFDYNQDDPALGGWSVITDTTGKELKVEFDETVDLTADGGMRGILVLANIDVEHVKESSTGNYVATTAHPVFIVQALNELGQSRSIRKSERFTSAEIEKYVWSSPQPSTAATQRPLYKDVAIRTFITQTGSTSLNLNYCTGIQISVAVANQDTTGLYSVAEVTLGRANLTAIVFRAGGSNYG